MDYEVEFPAATDAQHSKENNNIACFRVFNPQGKDISDQITYVLVFFNLNAMLGLGTELIRLAHNFEEGKEIHVVPSTKETGPQESMGIYLTPDSCELTIKCTSFPNIEEYLKEWKPEQK